jgi:large subunit ribosomal protein L14
LRLIILIGKCNSFNRLILKKTIINSASITNISKLKIIHLYRFGYSQNSKINFFIKSVPKKLKKFKYKEFKKKKKTVNLIIRTKEWSSREDGSFRKFNDNAAIILNKKLLPINSNVIGPTIFELNRKKYFYLFKNIY